MTAADKVQFLRAKVKAIATSGALTESDAKHSIDSHERSFERIAKSPREAPSFKFLDAELDTILRLAFRRRAEADAIRQRLKDQFGFSSLSLTVEAVANRVLKRGRIKDADEADQVRDFLSEEGNGGEVLGEDKMLELDGHLAAWEKRPAKRG